MKNIFHFIADHHPLAESVNGPVRVGLDAHHVIGIVERALVRLHLVLSDLRVNELEAVRR